MKLYELLKLISINDVIPIIANLYHKDCKYELVEYNYKRAYNELIGTEISYYPNDYIDLPGENSKEIWIVDSEFDNSSIPSACWLEGEIRSKALGKEIVLKCRENLSNEMLAAICLWHITFYGFTEEDIERTRKKFQNIEIEDGE